MGRLGRLGVIFGALLLAGSLLAWAMGLAQAGPVAAAAAFALLTWAGLLLRGRRPGFSRAERHQIFGRWHG
jgi:hypothetical protein